MGKYHVTDIVGKRCMVVFIVYRATYAPHHDQRYVNLFPPRKWLPSPRDSPTTMSLNRERLLQCVIEGAMETPPWQSLVREMRRSFRASHVDILFQRPKGPFIDYIQVVDFENHPSDIAERYRMRFGEGSEPLSSFAMQAGKVYRIRDLVKDFDSSPFLLEFLQPAGLDEILLCYVENTNGFRCWVSLARRQDAGLFTPDEIQAFEWLMGLFRGALGGYTALKKIELEREIYASALRNLHMGYLILDERGHVIETDAEAKRLLTGNDDIFVSGATLKLRHAEKNSELQAIIADGLKTTVDFSRGLNIPGSRSFGLMVKSAPDSPILASALAPRLVIYINEPNAPTAAPKARIAELFELSPTESALVVELVRGHTLAEAAARINISEHTARSYSKHIFRKTGTRRQSELIKLILTSVALVA